MIKEKDIIHENGNYWVYRDKDCYTVFKNLMTHALSDSHYELSNDGFSLAKARCDYLAQRSTSKC